jgi:hypothetical protein
MLWPSPEGLGDVTRSTTRDATQYRSAGLHPASSLPQTFFPWLSPSPTSACCFRTRRTERSVRVLLHWDRTLETQASLAMGCCHPKVTPGDAGQNARELISQVKRAHEYDMAQPSIMKFRGTLLPLVLNRWELWFFVSLHTVLVVAYRLQNDFEAGSGIPALPLMDITEMPWSTVMIPSGLLTFFLVFFNGKCYERFIGYYSAVTAINGNIQEIACQTLAAWPSSDLSGHRWEACRYLMASGIVVYMKVSDPPGKPQPIDEDEWDRLTQSEGGWLHEKDEICAPLLTLDEVEVLKQHRGNLQLLLQTWALRALRHGCIECMPPAESQLTYIEMERQARPATVGCNRAALVAGSTA